MRITILRDVIHEGLNVPKPAYRTLQAAIDISKAFDIVPCTLLIQKILNTNIETHTKKLLANNLTGDTHTPYTMTSHPQQNTTQTESLKDPFSPPHHSIFTCTAFPY